MAKIIAQDPLSTEIQSPFLAGLSEAVSKISGILNMSIGQLTDLPLQNVPITPEDKNRIYQATTGNRLWLNDPMPIFKKNGAVITPDIDGFSIDFVGGSITFDPLSILADGDTVTVSGKHILQGSQILLDIQTAANTALDSANRYKGAFATETALNTAEPTGTNGDIAVVLSIPAVFVWKDTKWANTQIIEDLNNYYDKTETDALLATKEPVILPKGVEVSADDFYYGGRKTYISVREKVRDTTLTGIDTTITGEVTTTDTVLSAVGKLQNQVRSAGHKIAGPDGIEVAQQPIMQFSGQGIVVTNNTETNRTIITINSDANTVCGYVGEVTFFTGATLQTNYVWADGSPVDATTWPDLATYAQVNNWETNESGQYLTPVIAGNVTGTDVDFTLYAQIRAKVEHVKAVGIDSYTKAETDAKINDAINAAIVTTLNTPI